MESCISTFELCRTDKGVIVPRDIPKRYQYPKTELRLTNSAARCLPTQSRCCRNNAIQSTAIQPKSPNKTNTNPVQSQRLMRPRSAKWGDYVCFVGRGSHPQTQIVLVEAMNAVLSHCLHRRAICPLLFSAWVSRYGVFGNKHSKSSHNHIFGPDRLAQQAFPLHTHARDTSVLSVSESLCNCPKQ